jgi:hypothetical protein
MLRVCFILLLLAVKDARGIDVIETEKGPFAFHYIMQSHRQVGRNMTVEIEQLSWSHRQLLAAFPVCTHACPRSPEWHCNSDLGEIFACWNGPASLFGGTVQRHSRSLHTVSARIPGTLRAEKEWAKHLRCSAFGWCLSVSKRLFFYINNNALKIGAVPHALTKMHDATDHNRQDAYGQISIISLTLCGNSSALALYLVESASTGNKKWIRPVWIDRSLENPVLDISNIITAHPDILLVNNDDRVSQTRTSDLGVYVLIGDSMLFLCNARGCGAIEHGHRHILSIRALYDYIDPTDMAMNPGVLYAHVPRLVMWSSEGVLDLRGGRSPVTYRDFDHRTFRGIRCSKTDYPVCVIFTDNQKIRFPTVVENSIHVSKKSTGTYAGVTTGDWVTVDSVDDKVSLYMDRIPVSSSPAMSMQVDRFVVEHNIPWMKRAAKIGRLREMHTGRAFDGDIQTKFVLWSAYGNGPVSGTPGIAKTVFEFASGEVLAGEDTSRLSSVLRNMEHVNNFKGVQQIEMVKLTAEDKAQARKRGTAEANKRIRDREKMGNERVRRRHENSENIKKKHAEYAAKLKKFENEPPIEGWARYLPPDQDLDDWYMQCRVANKTQMSATDYAYIQDISSSKPWTLFESLREAFHYCTEKIIVHSPVVEMSDFSIVLSEKGKLDERTTNITRTRGSFHLIGANINLLRTYCSDSQIYNCFESAIVNAPGSTSHIQIIGTDIEVTVIDRPLVVSNIEFVSKTNASNVQVMLQSSTSCVVINNAELTVGYNFRVSPVMIINSNGKDGCTTSISGLTVSGPLGHRMHESVYKKTVVLVNAGGSGLVFSDSKCAFTAPWSCVRVRLSGDIAAIRDVSGNTCGYGTVACFVIQDTFMANESYVVTENADFVNTPLGISTHGFHHVDVSNTRAQDISHTRHAAAIMIDKDNPFLFTPPVDALTRKVKMPRISPIRDTHEIRSIYFKNRHAGSVRMTDKYGRRLECRFGCGIPVKVTLFHDHHKSANIHDPERNVFRTGEMIHGHVVIDEHADLLITKNDITKKRFKLVVTHMELCVDFSREGTIEAYEYTSERHACNSHNYNTTRWTSLYQHPKDMRPQDATYKHVTVLEDDDPHVFVFSINVTGLETRRTHVSQLVISYDVVDISAALGTVPPENYVMRRIAPRHMNPSQIVSTNVQIACAHGKYPISRTIQGVPDHMFESCMTMLFADQMDTPAAPTYIDGTGAGVGLVLYAMAAVLFAAGSVICMCSVSLNYQYRGRIPYKSVHHIPIDRPLYDKLVGNYDQYPMDEFRKKVD